MIITLQRNIKGLNYCIGDLYIDNRFFCNTLEDVDRGLDSTFSLDNIKQIKVQDKTAIPYGKYKVTLNEVSPKYSNYSKYGWAKGINGKVPRLLNVPGFSGILIHPGNTAEDTSGCILVGKYNGGSTISNSQTTFRDLYNIMYNKVKVGEDIYIEIIK